MITRETLTAFEGPAGAVVEVLASGVGDAPDAAAVSRTVDGGMLRPPSPVHLRAVELPTGDLAISWVRRSRQGWAWSDGADTPMGEENERYHLALTGPGFERRIEATAAFYLYTAAERAADGPGPITLKVLQNGSLAASRPAILSIA